MWGFFLFFRITVWFTTRKALRATSYRIGRNVQLVGMAGEYGGCGVPLIWTNSRMNVGAFGMYMPSCHSNIADHKGHGHVCWGGQARGVGGVGGSQALPCLSSRSCPKKF
jgi:hypothetical protein